MNSKLVFLNIFRWIGLMVLQILFLRNINFYNIQSPFVYILFLILLPINTPNLVLYLTAFATGITLDIFYDTLGVHSAACIVFAFARILFFSVSLSKENYTDSSPSFRNLGITKFGLFILFCVVFHHLTFYFLETYKLSEIYYTLSKCFLNCIITFCLLLIIELIFYNHKILK